MFYLILLLIHRQGYTALNLHSIQSNMYLTSSFDFCPRYLTEQSSTGCSSRPSGNRGRLFNISSLTDLTSSQYSYPIIVLIPARKDILEYAIFDVPMVVGILIDGSVEKASEDSFTEVTKCPENFGDSSSCSIRKNPYGINLRGKSIDKPIFLLTNKTAVKQIKDISYFYNQQENFKGKFIDAHMRSYPYGVKNAEICSRRSKSTYFGEAYFKHYSIKCRSPMINIIWATFNAIPYKRTRPPKSVIVFYTKMDFFSIFQPKTAGAQSTAFGVVTLLGLAWVLGRIELSQLLLSNKDDKDILLLFLNGENWNYYGRFELNKMIIEKRFPYTIGKSSGKENLHPIESDHIDILINIDQLGINDKTTYILYDNIHPFLNKFQEIATSTILQKFTEPFDSLADFRQLNLSTIAMITNAYENMNRLYNSYQDNLQNIEIVHSSIETHIYSLVKTICSYLKLSTCISDLSVEVKQALTDRIDRLFDCFLRLNCSNLISKTNETGEFYFKEVSDQMKENFSFLQPILHPSDAKNYISNHFLDASSYIHDILLNWIAVRTTDTNQNACEQTEDVFRSKFYQESTSTCLRVSIDSINLIRNDDDLIDERIIFVSNSDQPELLIYMVNNIKREILIVISGLVLTISGMFLVYFLKKLLPLLLNEDEM